MGVCVGGCVVGVTVVSGPRPRHIPTLPYLFPVAFPTLPRLTPPHTTRTCSSVAAWPSVVELAPTASVQMAASSGCESSPLFIISSNSGIAVSPGAEVRWVGGSARGGARVWLCW